MASFDLLYVLTDGKTKRLPSSTNVVDFSSIRIGTTPVQLSESSGNLDLGSAQVLSAGVPTLSNSLVNKNYVDNLISGLNWKSPARALASANLTLSGIQTVDGVALVAGDRVLCVGQTGNVNNGVYIVAAGAWARSTDMASATQVYQAAIFISEGSVGNADTAWVCTTDNPITVGTTALVFVKFSNSTITVDQGLTLTGNQINVVAGEGLKTATGSVFVDYTRPLVNADASAVTIRQVVYVKSNGQVDLALASTISIDTELGVVADASIATTATGNVVIRRGARVTGFSGMTPGKRQFVSRSTAGALVENLTGFIAGEQVYMVGRALSATELLFAPMYNFEF